MSITHKTYTVSELEAIRSFIFDAYYDHEISPADYLFLMDKTDQMLDLIYKHAFDEPPADLYGTPWGQMLTKADANALNVKDAPTITIPPGITDVE